MNAIVKIETQVTITSLEIVDFINQHRKESGDTTVLRHDHFMAKVPKVLGEEAAPKFLGDDIFTNGTGGQVERKVYIFPKREACLMAMSYSYELQAKVFDRMTAMEDALKNQTPDPIQLLADPNLLRNALLTYILKKSSSLNRKLKSCNQPSMLLIELPRQMGVYV